METFKRILVIIIVCAAILFLMTIQGCKTVEYVPIYHHDTTYVSKIEHDSVFLKDSTYVITRNDTVFFTKYIDRFKYINRTDTVYKSNTDTLTVVEEKIVEKEVCPKPNVFTRTRDTFAILGLVLTMLVIFYIYLRKQSK